MDSSSEFRQDRGQNLGMHLLDVFAEAGVACLLVDQTLAVVACKGGVDAWAGMPLAAGGRLPGTLRDLCAQALATGVPAVDVTCPVGEEPSASPRCVQLTAMPLFDALGASSGAILLLRSPPHALGAAEEGRTGEDRLAAALAAAGAAPFTFNAASQMAVVGHRPWACSSEVPTNLAVTLDELIACAHPDDKARLRAALTHPSPGEEINCPYRVLQPDGAVHWYAMRGRATFASGGEHKETAGVFLDMDEDRRRSHAALEAANVSIAHETRMAHALKAARATTFRYDLGNRTLHYEDDVLRAYNLPPGQPVSFETILEHLPPEDHRPVLGAFAKLDAGESTSLYLNYQIAHPTLGQRLCTIVGEVTGGGDGASPSLMGIYFDLTAAREQEEERLRLARLVQQRNQDLGLALDAANAGCFHADIATGSISVWRPALSHPGGGIDDGAHIPIPPLADLLNADDLPLVTATITGALAGETNDISLECCLNEANGGLWLDLRGRIVRNDDNRPISISGIFSDVTKRKLSEKAHRAFLEAALARDAEMEIVLEMIGGGIIRHNFQTRTSNPSNALRKLYALPPEPGLIGQDDWFDLIHVTDRERIRQELKAALLAGRELLTSEFMITTQAGGLRWISSRTRLTYDGDGQPLAATGLALDVTEHKERERFLSLALEKLSAGHFDFNPATQSGHTSPAVNDLFGFPNGPMATTDQWMAAIHPDDREQIHSNYQQAIGRQQSRLDRVYRIVHPDHGERWIDDRRLNFYGNDGVHVHTFGIMFNVTAQKQRERELLDLIGEADAARTDAQDKAATLAVRDRQWRLAFDAASIGPLEYDIPGRKFLVPLNKAGQEASDLETKFITFEKILSGVHPDDLERFEEAFLEVNLNARKHVSVEYRFIFRSGATRWILTRGQVIDEGPGPARRLAGISLDITEAKSREADLAESRKRLQQAARAAKAATFVYDVMNKTVSFDWDPANGRPKEDGLMVGGAAALQHLHSEDRAMLQQMMANAIAGHHQSFSVDFAHPATLPGMPPCWVSLRAQAQYDSGGRPWRIIGLLLDVTEKKQREAALKAQQDLLANALEAAGAVVVSYDYGLERLTFNHVPHLLKSVLPSYPEHVQPAAMLDLINPDDVSKTKEVLDHALPESHDRISIVVRSRADTFPMWMAIKGRVERDALGQRKTFHGFLVDITRQRMAEVALIDASRLAMIGELATGVAHELRQPLNAIKLAAHNLQRKSAAGTLGDTNSLAERLSLIARNVERADRVISALRNLSRKPNGDKVFFDVADTLRELILLQSDVIREAGVHLNVDLEDGIRIYGEPYRLEQAVLNLLTNAIHAASRNPAKEEARLDLSLKADPRLGIVEVVVTDNGPGIDAAILPSIFTPFMTTKVASEGTGLGLSIVHNIVVKEFGGTVTAGNTKSGAIFRICLALPSEVAAKGHSPHPQPAA